MFFAAVAAVAGFLGITHLLAKLRPSSVTAPIRTAEDFPSVAPKHAAEHRAARPILLQAFAEEGETPTLPEVQYTQGIGWQETSYGKGWGPVAAKLNNPELLNLNNWASEQCSPLGPDCVGGEDHLPDGTSFPMGFKKSDTPVAGARRLVKQVLKNRRSVQTLLRSPDATVMRTSYLMRRQNFYWGFCANAAKQYGSEAAKASTKNPDRDQGTKACAREAIELHARLLWDAIKDIAGAVGDGSVIPLGTYEDADAWYQSRR